MSSKISSRFYRFKKDELTMKESCVLFVVAPYMLVVRALDEDRAAHVAIIHGS